MNLLLVVTFLIQLFSLAKSAEVGSFEEYITTFRKTYAGQTEHEFRYKVFNDNLEMIREHNRNPNASYKMGINQFTDMTGNSLV